MQKHLVTLGLLVVSGSASALVAPPPVDLPTPSTWLLFGSAAIAAGIIYLRNRRK